MHITLEKGGKLYKVRSEHNPNKFYLVDIDKRTCTCPNFRFRMSRMKGVCKHIIAVEENLRQKSGSIYSKIIEFVRKNGEVDSLMLIKKFGEEAVEELIKIGELIEEKGTVKILE